ncbi:MAG TPA: glycoside hydrolase family 44 protein [Polyangiaceae bacterium]|nr:glycoside hydrolase family 44 protein [Polyangiaceae bacterium]
MKHPLRLCVLLLAGCIAPPPESPASQSVAGRSADSGVSRPTRYYEASWADCSGADGQGGVKLELGPKRIPQRREAFPRELAGDASTARHPEWLIFRSSDGHALSLEWIWVTTEQDKFWGKMWAGSGLAMNKSWSAIDASSAKYLVFYARASEPSDGGDLSLKLHVESGSKGKKETGAVLLSSFAEGKRLKTEWTRVIIPLASFPEVDQVDLKTLTSIGLDVVGKYPENKPVFIRVENVYLSDVEMVTQVDGLGVLAEGNQATLVWDKQAGERVSAFSVQVDGKEVRRVPPTTRTLELTLATGKHEISVITVGERESSAPAKVQANIAPQTPFDAVIEVAAESRHPVPPYFNSTNFMTTAELRDAGFQSTRWGGNATSKYNYKRDLSSSGSDWFFLNQVAKPEGTPEREKSYYQFIQTALAAGTDVNFTIPIIPWIAKPAPTADGRLCSFPASLYPQQHKIGSEKCGDGLKPDGKEKIAGNDAALAMIPNSPEFQQGLVSQITTQFPGRVKFFTLDNEPGLWKETHRDVFPKGYRTDELLDLSTRYASMIKSVNPAAQIIGLAAWGMMELAGSNLDYSSDWTDRKAHADEPNLVSFVRGMRKASESQGKRLLDVVDVHWYPEVYYVKGGKKLRLSDDIDFDPVVAEKQFEALREFWDPTFKLADVGLESWAFSGGNDVRLWTPFHPTIRALKGIVDRAWPGTKLAFNEYSSGSGNRYHGALLRAALLGIFMQEDLYMAQVWAQPGKTSFSFYAHKLYGNYDGHGGRVRGAFVPTTSSNKDLLVYAARDGARTYVVIVNKNQRGPASATIRLPTESHSVQAFTLAESLGLRVFAGPRKPASGRQVTVHVPAFAAELVVLE